MQKLLPLFMVIAALAGCAGRSSSTGIIPEEKFADIYVALLDNAPEGGGRRDSLRGVDSLLTAMGVTEYQYRKTVQYYSEDVERWREFYGKVVTRLEDRRKRETPGQTPQPPDPPSQPSSE